MVVMFQCIQVLTAEDALAINAECVQMKDTFSHAANLHAEAQLSPSRWMEEACGQTRVL